MTTEFEITRSCGNVFLDMGIEPGRAAALSVRSQLMLDLKHAIARLDRAKAARKLKVDGKVITALRRGRIDEFDVDLLVRLLMRAGFEVRVTASRAPARRSRA